jgi:periplasmic copper chaperone A
VRHPLPARRPARAAAGLGAIALLATVAAPAGAHVTTSVREAPAGGYTKFELRVPHGCEGESPGADTVRVEVQIPAEIEQVTPQVVPGWEITVDRVDLDQPRDDGHGGQITDRVGSISWEGGPLATDQLEEFGLSVRMPDLPGETLYFPVVQTCQSGEELAWIQIPAGDEDGELDHPAPAIRLTEGGDGHGSPTDDGTDGDADAVGDDTAGDDGTAGAPATGDDAGTGEQAAAATSDDGTDTLAVVALVVAVLALLLGGGALAVGRRRT